MPPRLQTSLRLAIIATPLTASALVLGCERSQSVPAGEGVPAGSEVSGRFDPCALLTKKEVQAVVSWTVVKATPYVTGDHGHCTYEGEKGKNTLPPEQVDAGIIACWTNFPCASDMPTHFSNSAELVAYRIRLYEGNSYNLDPAITPIEGLGLPALMHELATYYTMEMWFGNRRLGFVSVWESGDGARSLGEKLLSRAR